MATKLRKDDGTFLDVDDITGMVAAGGVDPLTENAGAIGGANDGNLPNLTATVGADIAAFTDPPSAAEMALLRTFVNALKVDNVALRAAARENAAKINELIAALEG